MTPNYIHRFTQLFPDLVTAMQQTIQQTPYHLEGSVWTHTCMVYQHLLALHGHSRVLLLTALLHDIGKVWTCRLSSVPASALKSTYHGHEGVSFLLALDLLNRLEPDLTTSEVTEVLQVVGLHGVNVSQIPYVPYLDMFRKADQSARITDIAKEDYPPFSFSTSPRTTTYISTYRISDYAPMLFTRSARRVLLNTNPNTISLVVEVPSFESFPSSTSRLAAIDRWRSFVPPVLAEGFHSIEYHYADRS